MTEKIRSRILAIRDSGRTNMLDADAVQVIADDLDFHELVIFIEEHRREYAEFILFGDRN